MPSLPSFPPRATVIGGGPAGLMAAEVLAHGGAQVDLFDAMPSVGRKFLLAGRGGLNLTHSEPTTALLERYGPRSEPLRAAVAAFDGDAVRAWAAGLGIATFVGTSGRVFPSDMKAAPLLRAWLHRLRASGVRLHTGIAGPAGRPMARCASWRRPARSRTRPMPRCSPSAVPAGRAWAQTAHGCPGCRSRRAAIAPLAPSNCGFDVAPTAAGRTGWSDHLRQRFAGQPVKPVAARFVDAGGHVHEQQGEFVLTDTGVEGSLVYAFSARLRDRIAAQGQATWLVDLLPQHSQAQVLAEVARPRGPRSLSTHLKSRLGLQGLKMALLHELLAPAATARPRGAGAGDQGPAAHAGAAAPARRGDQHGRRCPLRRAGRARHGARRARACSAPARCWTGKRRPAATCSRPAWRQGAAPAPARCNGWPPAPDRTMGPPPRAASRQL